MPLNGSFADFRMMGSPIYESLRKFNMIGYQFYHMIGKTVLIQVYLVENK